MMAPHLAPRSLARGYLGVRSPAGCAQVVGEAAGSGEGAGGCRQNAAAGQVFSFSPVPPGPGPAHTGHMHPSATAPASLLALADWQSGGGALASLTLHQKFEAGPRLT
jgi:hypothetical protein